MKHSPLITLLALALLSGKCGENTSTSDKKKDMQSSAAEHAHTNDLIHESSPYLLQHAHNPVNWHAWNEKTLKMAREENKPMIISIGYSACHWCHVMERESFEDEEVAKLMNENFICIKVDREERPDVDQVYLNAVQLITGQAGWPLNAFALPDGRPFYGGTYFTKKNWMTLLENILVEYKESSDKIKEYADRLVSGIKGPEDLQPNKIEYQARNLLDTTVQTWKALFDNQYGGMERAPKFPLPNNYEFLMYYAWKTKAMDVKAHVELTLDEMARGGIYDQVGGGFARYSTDRIWKVPHFEKMLYDNAQLVSLYAKAYRWFGKELYRKTAEETLEFIERELGNGKHGYYAALDADSEGEEGAFYVWRSDELRNLAEKDFNFLKLWLNVQDSAIWEDGKFVLHQVISDEELMQEFQLDASGLKEKKAALKKTLFNARKKRERPGTDDKILTSWNALMITAYTEAYRSFGNEDYLKKATSCARFIWEKQHSEQGYLFRTYKNGKSAIPAFLEDYGLVIQAFIDLYEVSLDEDWLKHADELTQYCFEHFHKSNNDFFFFAPKSSELVARNVDLMDNVIPSSNSIMANALWSLGQIIDSAKYTETATRMLNNVAPYVSGYGSSYSNWCILMLKQAYGTKEVAVSGPDAADFILKLGSVYAPDVLFMGSRGESKLPLLESKFVDGKTMIYVCENKTCKLPVEDVEKALQQIVSK